MDIKNIKSLVLGFVKDINNESKKVVWPGKQYVIAATIIVLIIVVLVSLFITFIDFGFAKFFSAISKQGLR